MTKPRTRAPKPTAEQRKLQQAQDRLDEARHRENIANRVIGSKERQVRAASDAMRGMQLMLCSIHALLGGDLPDSFYAAPTRGAKIYDLDDDVPF